MTKTQYCLKVFFWRGLEFSVGEGEFNNVMWLVESGCPVEYPVSSTVPTLNFTLQARKTIRSQC